MRLSTALPCTSKFKGIGTRRSDVKSILFGWKRLKPLINHESMILEFYIFVDIALPRMRILLSFTFILNCSRLRGAAVLGLVVLQIRCIPILLHLNPIKMNESIIKHSIKVSTFILNFSHLQTIYTDSISILWITHSHQAEISSLTSKSLNPK